MPEPNAVDTFAVSLKRNFPERIVAMDKSEFRAIIMDIDIPLNVWSVQDYVHFSEFTFYKSE